MNFTNFRVENDPNLPLATVKVMADCIENGRTALARFHVSRREILAGICEEDYIARAKDKLAAMHAPAEGLTATTWK